MSPPQFQRGVKCVPLLLHPKKADTYLGKIPLPLSHGLPLVKAFLSHKIWYIVVHSLLLSCWQGSKSAV